jgi:hypothetical protein
MTNKAQREEIRSHITLELVTGKLLHNLGQRQCLQIFPMHCVSEHVLCFDSLHVKFII